MFLNSVDFLNQLIDLYNSLDYPNNKNLMTNKESIELHCPIVNSFVFNEIESFSEVIIEDLLDTCLFNFEFANRIYEFQKHLFEKKIKNGIKKYLEKFPFDEILQIVGNFKYDLQAIMGYEGIFEEIYEKDSIQNNKKTCYDLGRKLQGFIGSPVFSQMADDKRSRIIKMAKCLPIYPEDLGETTKLLITNLENTMHLNVKMARDVNNSASVAFPTLIFDTNEMNWRVRHFKDENLFEIERPNGQVLCWVKPHLNILTRILPAETIFMDKEEATNTKWKIEYFEEGGDPSKGFLIKSSDDNVYLCGARPGEFSIFVSVVKKIDLEHRERFAWKFQRVDYAVSS